MSLPLAKWTHAQVLATLGTVECNVSNKILRFVEHYQFTGADVARPTFVSHTFAPELNAKFGIVDAHINTLVECIGEMRAGAVKCCSAEEAAVVAILSSNSASSASTTRSAAALTSTIDESDEATVARIKREALASMPDASKAEASLRLTAMIMNRMERLRKQKEADPAKAAEVDGKLNALKEELKQLIAFRRSAGVPVPGNHDLMRAREEDAALFAKKTAVAEKSSASAATAGGGAAAAPKPAGKAAQRASEDAEEELTPADRAVKARIEALELREFSELGLRFPVLPGWRVVSAGESAPSGSAHAIMQPLCEAPEGQSDEERQRERFPLEKTKVNIRCADVSSRGLDVKDMAATEIRSLVAELQAVFANASIQIRPEIVANAPCAGHGFFQHIFVLKINTQVLPPLIIAAYIALHKGISQQVVFSGNEAAFAQLQPNFTLQHLSWACARAERTDAVAQWVDLPRSLRKAFHSVPLGVGAGGPSCAARLPDAARASVRVPYFWSVSVVGDISLDERIVPRDTVLALFALPGDAAQTTLVRRAAILSREPDFSGTGTGFTLIKTEQLSSSSGAGGGAAQNEQNNEQIEVKTYDRPRTFTAEEQQAVSRMVAEGRELTPGIDRQQVRVVRRRVGAEGPASRTVWLCTSPITTANVELVAPIACLAEVIKTVSFERSCADCSEEVASNDGDDAAESPAAGAAGAGAAASRAERQGGGAEGEAEQVGGEYHYFACHRWAASFAVRVRSEATVQALTTGDPLIIISPLGGVQNPALLAIEDPNERAMLAAMQPNAIFRVGTPDGAEGEEGLSGDLDEWLAFMSTGADGGATAGSNSARRITIAGRDFVVNDVPPDTSDGQEGSCAVRNYVTMMPNAHAGQSRVSMLMRFEVPSGNFADGEEEAVALVSHMKLI